MERPARWEPEAAQRWDDDTPKGCLVGTVAAAWGVNGRPNASAWVRIRLELLVSWDKPSARLRVHVEDWLHLMGNDSSKATHAAFSRSRFFR